MAETVSSAELALQRQLWELVLGVGREEGFSFEPLEAKYKKYYVPVVSKDGCRCVDGRLPLLAFLSKDTYRGRQLAGGSAGEISALRLVAGLDEPTARNVLAAAYEQAVRVLGNHNDDQHSTITDPKELEKRFKGCGNQDQSAEGHLPMYADLELNESVITDRAEWIQANGFYPALTGHHQEKGRAVNLTGGTTFDTQTAVQEGNSLFNLDVREAWEFAPAIYQQLPDEVKAKFTQEQFRSDMVKALVRDYFQTLSVLNQPKHIQVNAILA